MQSAAQLSLTSLFREKEEELPHKRRKTTGKGLLLSPYRGWRGHRERGEGPTVEIKGKLSVGMVF